jgi:hypothetical protein
MRSQKSEVRSQKQFATATAWAVAAVLSAGGVVWGQASATQPATSAPGAGGAAGAFAAHPAVGGAKTGGVRVLLSQATKGGPAIGEDPVTVELYARGKVLKTYQTKADAKGVVELRDLPLEQAFQPVVTVLHGGAPQRLVGGEVTKYQPAIEFEMKVYESTETRPDWTIGMRYVTMIPQGLGKVTSLKIEETIGGYNPLDRAWLGTENAAKEREAFAVTLPADATDVVLGMGMLEAGAKMVDGKLVRPGPMLPDSTAYVFGYTVPVKDGKATVSFVAPAKVSLLAVYAPAGAKAVKVEGLEAGKAQGGHGKPGDLMFKAKDVKAGAVATVELSDISYAAPAQDLKPEGK